MSRVVDFSATVQRNKKCPRSIVSYVNQLAKSAITRVQKLVAELDKPMDSLFQMNQEFAEKIFDFSASERPEDISISHIVSLLDLQIREMAMRISSEKRFRGEDVSTVRIFRKVLFVAADMCTRFNHLFGNNTPCPADDETFSGVSLIWADYIKNQSAKFQNRDERSAEREKKRQSAESFRLFEKTCCIDKTDPQYRQKLSESYSLFVKQNH